MPPNPPTGWNIPPTLQVIAVLAFIATPFLAVLLNYWLKDRRTLKNSEGDNLRDDQAQFIDKILKAAEMAPQLMEKNEKLIQAHADDQAEIRVLKERVEKLEEQVQALERDRDSWRDQAQQVPLLQGQVQTYQTLLQEKVEQLDNVKQERDGLQRALTELRSLTGYTDGVPGRRATDPPKTLIPAAIVQEERTS